VSKGRADLPQRLKWGQGSRKVPMGGECAVILVVFFTLRCYSQKNRDVVNYAGAAPGVLGFLTRMM